MPSFCKGTWRRGVQGAGPAAAEADGSTDEVPEDDLASEYRGELGPTANHRSFLGTLSLLIGHAEAGKAPVVDDEHVELTSYFTDSLG